MIHKKSLFLQMIILIGFPSILIITIIECILIFMLNQNSIQLGVIQNKLIFVFGMGLLLVICVMIISIHRFSRRPRGANASAIIYSIIETAKENNLIPFEYLTYLFERLPNEDIDNMRVLDSLMPWSEALPERCKIQNR